MVTINFNLLGNIILTIIGIIALIYLIMTLKSSKRISKESSWSTR